MGILDRFRTAAPPPTSPRGGSGRANFGGFPESDERNVDLVGRRGLAKFDEMFRGDPDVRKVVRMACNPLLGATWSVTPFGGDEAEDKDREVADAAKWALFTNMAPNFKGHLGEALPILVRSGFVPFEEVWETVERNGRKMIVPRTLGLCLPRSIFRFIQEGSDLVELEQMLGTGRMVKLPVEDLIYYRVGAEGDNWEGTSLLRPAFKPWYFKDKLERVDVIKQEREAMGIPIAYPPKGASKAQLDEMEAILKSVRTSEGGFILAPGPHAQDLAEEALNNGWRIEILSVGTRATSDINPSIERQTDKVAAAFIADFMRLGQGTESVGARATADVQQNPFLSAVEALASEVEAALQPLVNRFTALNFDVEEPPTLTMSLVDSTSLTELATYAKTLIEAGALHPDNELEDFYRQRGDLPPADAEARKAREEQAESLREAAQKGAENPTPAPTEPPKPGQPAPPPAKPGQPQPPQPAPAKDEPELEPCTGAMDASERREMRWWEELMSLDEIETAIDTARERFEAAGGPAARALAKQMAEDAHAGKTVTPKADPDLQRALYGEMARLYRTGRSTVIDELNAQRPGTTNKDSLEASDALADARRRLEARAKLAAQSIGNRIWQSVSHAGIKRPGDLASMQRAGEEEAGAGLRAEAQLHAAGALNEGRGDEALANADEIEGARYTSILDARRCDSCALADDDVLRKLDDPVRLAHEPPNPDCFGGGRCRCMEFFELIDESPGYAGPTAPPEPPLRPPEGPGGVADDHFDLSGGTTAQQALVQDQIAAIDSVHRFPKSIPRVPLEIRPTLKNKGREVLGKWSASGVNVATRQLVGERLQLSAKALRMDPPMTSTVHEIGHCLDAHGFGDGVPVEVVLDSNGRDLYSSTPAMAEWREAVTSSPAYARLVADPDNYRETIRELLARSYEQYIAERSGNEILITKIAKRREENPDVYWSEAEFAPIGAAFDRFFATRGLR